MMKEEFERIAGYEVSYYDYKNIIEPMYLATNLNKSEFVKKLNRKEFEITPKTKALEEIRITAESIRLNPVKSGMFFAPDYFISMIEEFAIRFYNTNATWLGCEYDEIRKVEYPCQFKIFTAQNKELDSFKLF